MKVTERHLLFGSILFLAFAYLLSSALIRNRRQENDRTLYLQWKKQLPDFFSKFHDPDHDLDNEEIVSSFSSCEMHNCFNFSKCSSRPILHYVYPDDNSGPISSTYTKILRVLKSSPYATDDPDKACLFILSIDTLDRDVLSEDKFVRNMNSRLKKLSHWSGGQNHIIFNLYSGTYPDYAEDLGFDVGQAILAKASFSEWTYRPGFDVSLPLFHPNHKEKHSEQTGLITENAFPNVKKHFLAFKVNS